MLKDSSVLQFLSMQVFLSRNVPEISLIRRISIDFDCLHRPCALYMYDGRNSCGYFLCKHLKTFLVMYIFVTNYSLQFISVQNCCLDRVTVSVSYIPHTTHIPKYPILCRIREYFMLPNTTIIHQDSLAFVQFLQGVMFKKLQNFPIVKFSCSTVLVTITNYSIIFTIDPKNCSFPTPKTGFKEKLR